MLTFRAWCLNEEKKEADKKVTLKSAQSAERTKSDMITETRESTSALRKARLLDALSDRSSKVSNP